ncbi:hypothetical protein [Desulfotruncus alcoholivorax]|uniref:hypothetical protein n=1 Tax=Desulfotruncus alcoholivorax TaxID=265477 RepID=UPI00040682EC|nr:hypothetical protein [Desulfotruncus alcoholivorax]
MTNEEFQTLVLQQLQALAGSVKSLEEGQKLLEEGQTRVESRISKFEMFCTDLH